MELKEELEKFKKEREALINQVNQITTQIIRREGIINFLTIKIQEQEDELEVK